MITVSKVCARCKADKPVGEFYKRKHCGGYVSECKDCMKERTRAGTNHLEPHVPRAATEITAINYLHKRGIPSLPGKALSYSHVDVVCFGCVRIEVKYASLQTKQGVSKFTFVATPAQMEHGFRADVIMLVCEYPGGRLTFHFFDPADPVFYMDGRIKSGFTFTPGAMEAKKHGDTRVVMTQPLMDAAEDRVELVYEALRDKVAELKGGN